MSECYDVSLDYLLKGEQKMKSYYDYLEESTNVVKSNANRNLSLIHIQMCIRDSDKDSTKKELLQEQAKLVDESADLKVPLTDWLNCTKIMPKSIIIRQIV